ncbi:hypothetical protein [Shewanella kaireitica]|uniref:hypothetical protein n=1 Tax=Shewanella kaireitica TaxID=212021 RepID=UPI00200EA62D|nr:hypothetical protein [Shewanella kaireitica]MCL1092872.1 hypothetical protein [Shewanella kaireitica]
MGINFDVLIDSDDYSVDMNTGLETLKGASEVTRKIAGTLLTEHVPKNLTNENKVRTKLKKSFKGSFGQTFTLEIEDLELKKRFNKIGKEPFAELVSYFIHEALYLESAELSKKAQKTLDNLGDILEEKLTEELRVSSLAHLHSVATSFNQEVKLRFRQSRAEQIILAELDRTSSATLKSKTDTKEIRIEASITRLNINTGNGRLQLFDAGETVAFGFPAQVKFREQNRSLKQKFSDNLHINNGLKNRDDWKTLKLKAYTKKTNNNRIIKYLIIGIIDD